MNEENIFAPMAPMPEQISKALFGTPSTPTDNEESEDALDLFQRTTAIPNPWAPRTDGDGRLNFIAEDEEEIALAAPIEHIKKMFAHPTPARIAPKLGDLRVLPEEDFDEKEFSCPIKKLFFATAASTEAPRLQLSKRAAPTQASEAIEKYGTEPDPELDEGLQEALDAAINDCLPSSSDESTFDFFRRVDARLQILGHKAILSTPTWATSAY